MHKVTWKAQEMTNQRAGVEVKGFAIWGIYRPDAEDPDGPFRAYKSIPGLADGDVTAGSQFVQQLVESIIRSSVANMSIMGVMQKRDAMRDKVKKEITSQLKGWGIWLETVEIIDCRISSQSLCGELGLGAVRKRELVVREALHVLEEGLGGDAAVDDFDRLEPDAPALEL